MTTTWHMARVASRRQLQKPRKMHGPVGESSMKLLMKAHDAGLDMNTLMWNSAETSPKCDGCGYHVCSCEPVEECPSCGPMPRGTELTHKCPPPNCQVYALQQELSGTPGDHRGLRALLDSDIRFGE